MSSTSPRSATDALQRVLDGMRLDGTIYCLFEGLDAWGLRLPAAPQARFHAVRSGKCWLRVGNEDPIPIEAGEFVLLPQGHQHDVLAMPDSETIDVTHAFGDADPYQKVFRVGDGELRASLICGGFDLDDADLHPLPACLPPIIRLRADDPRNAGLLGLLDLLHAELQGPHLASNLVLRRLSEILFIAAVRVFAASDQSRESNWLGGLADPAVGAALSAMHSNPQREWSIVELAQEAGVSRTTLNERFQQFVGVPPHRYLTRWRMIEARRLLRETDITISEISGRVGYASEAAFSRAFLREVGKPPSNWRSGANNRSNEH